MAPAATLIERFLGEYGAGSRRRHAYAIDLFSRFRMTSSSAAVGGLLESGPDSAHRLLLSYAAHLRNSGHTPAAVDRALRTLRGLARTARSDGMIEWMLRVPSDDEITSEAESLPAGESDRYIFPRHVSETDRLDIQHYALREVLRGNHLAPVQRPRLILDVGCGSGQWGFELSEEFPGALVVGLDLVSGKPAEGRRYRLIKGNVLNGLPFADGSFDFVHQRLLVTGVPVAVWPDAVAELARVTRPGGWIELVEGRWGFEDAGPATDRLMARVKELSGSLGLDTTGEVHRSLDRYLREAGLQEVRRQEVALPVGDWGGSVGSLMATDFRTSATRISEVLQARGTLSAEEARALIGAAWEECEHGRMAQPCAVAYGRKPL